VSLNVLFLYGRIVTQNFSAPAIIIGGGLVGCVAALSLFKNAPDVSCLIIDDVNSLTFKVYPFAGVWIPLLNENAVVYMGLL